MKKGLDIISIFGGPSDDEESETDMACKALWKSLKRDDYEAFKAALADYLEYREGSKTETDVDDED